MQVWSRNNENAISLALDIGADSILSIADLSNEVEMVVLAISDDAIESVSAQVPQLPGRIIVHTSGSTNISVLAKSALNYGVLYPIQTFSKNTDLDFSLIPLCVEGNNAETEQQIYEIAKSLSDKVQIVNSENRMYLHIAAVFACNFTNYFYQIGTEICEKANLDFNLIRPLIQETADKVMLNSPINVQTGPAKRNDVLTMDKHLALLQKQPDLQYLYQVISQDIVKKYNPG